MIRTAFKKLELVVVELLALRPAVVELVALRQVAARRGPRPPHLTRPAYIPSILLLLLAAACATSKVEDKNGAWKTTPPKEKSTKSAKPARQATAVVVPEAPPRTRILPLNARVVSVKNDLRFVLIDFTNSRRPSLDERLNVYRVGQKVAEIKISGPFLNTTVAADLLAGDARYGDEVKAE